MGSIFGGYLSSLDGLDRSISVIVCSEIGDKTFLIAAILAMRHPRSTIFLGAFGALVVMSILSSAMGAILPSLLPKRWTTIAASLLFWVFGIRMLYEGWHMEGGNEAMEEEMREVQKEVELAEMEVSGGAPGRTRGSQVDLESGIMEEEEGRSPNTPGGASSRPRSPFMNGGGVSPGSSSNIPERKRRRSSLQLPPFPDISQSLPASARKAASDTLRQGFKTFSEGAKNLCQLFFSPILIQAFILTFLAEWGDRSQITTIALAAAHNVYLVTLGTVLGHAFCTFLAVIGGRWLATKISVKHVTLGGAVLFVIFGAIYTLEAYYWDELTGESTFDLSSMFGKAAGLASEGQIGEVGA